MSDLGWPLRRAERLHGDRPAVVADGRSLTYAALAARVGSLALAPGTRVGFLGANSLAHVEAWLGVPAAGGVLVSLNVRLLAGELAFIARDAELSLLVADDEHRDLARGLGCELADWEDLVGGPRATPRDHDPGTLAAISYTGGTTGTPKGVMLSHGNLFANAQHNLAATGHRPDQRWLHVCPMFHVAGIANLLACTWVGAAQFVLPRFDAAAVLAAIERERITHTVLVPTMLAMLLDVPGSEDADLSSLRHVQYAASPISADLQRRVLERLPQCDVAQFCGMTEAAPTVTHLTPEDHRRGRALASVGTPVPGVETEVRGPVGERLEPGEAVHAVVTTRAAIGAEALLDHCRAHIAGFKVPREIELRDEPLPKSGAGKVLKTRLRERFWAGHERRVS